jgi:hypothetical protein
MELVAIVEVMFQSLLSDLLHNLQDIKIPYYELFILLILL